MCECACACLYAPGEYAVPGTDCGIGWSKSGWWSFSCIQAGQGLLCDRTVRADEFAKADRGNKAWSASRRLLPRDDEIYGAARGVNSDQTALPSAKVKSNMCFYMMDEIIHILIHQNLCHRFSTYHCNT